jgi:hypothetical protein
MVVMVLVGVVGRKARRRLCSADRLSSASSGVRRRARLLRLRALRCVVSVSWCQRQMSGRERDG